MLDQTDQIKLVTISTYEGFKKLISNLYKNIACIYTHTLTYVYVFITLSAKFSFCAKAHNSTEPNRFKCLCRK